MSDFKNFLKNVGYFGVGAAAVVFDAAGKAVKVLVRKGEEVLRDNQDTVDEMKRKAKEAGERIKEAVDDFKTKTEPTMEAEAPEAEDAQPVVPDAVYHTDEPVPEEELPQEEPAAEEESPKDTVNG